MNKYTSSSHKQADSLLRSFSAIPSMQNRQRICTIRRIAKCYSNEKILQHDIGNLAQAIGNYPAAEVVWCQVESHMAKRCMLLYVLLVLLFV